MSRTTWLMAALLTLSSGPVRAADVDDLLLALKRARTLAVRGQAEVTVNFPPRPEPTRRAAQLPDVPFRPALLKRNFTVSRSSPETLADRTATRYELSPHNAGASRWTLWVDTTWNLPLAYEERLADGSLARRAVFVKVRAAPAKVSRPVRAVPAGLRAALLRALPGLRLPAGFVPLEVRRQGERWTVTLSDGLNVLALVAAPRGVQGAPGVASRKAGTRSVWLVGALPQNALRDALAGVREPDPESLGTFVTLPDSNP